MTKRKTTEERMNAIATMQPWFFDIVADALKASEEGRRFAVELRMSNGPAAGNLRQRFHIFRALAVAQSFPGAAEATQLMLQIAFAQDAASARAMVDAGTHTLSLKEGACWLCFTSVPTPELYVARRLSEVAQLQQEEVDYTEEATARLLGVKLINTPTPTPTQTNTQTRPCTACLGQPGLIQCPDCHGTGRVAE